MTTLSNIETLALSKLKASKGTRDEIAPGQYSGSVTVTVNYNLKVGEDYEQRIVAKADPWLLFATAMSKLNGVTVDSIVREALAGELDTKEVKAQASNAMLAVKGETWTDCKGKVTGKVNVTGKMISPE